MSLTHEQATAALLEEFAASWGSTTPVAYPNLAFEPPENAPWVRVAVLHGEAAQVGLGTSPCFRRPGVVIVQIFTPEAASGQPALALADLVVDALQRRQLAPSGVQLQASSVREVGPDGRGRYQVNVSTPFFWHQRP